MGLETVPVVVRNLNDHEALAISPIENLQREDLNPVEETEGILSLIAIELDIPARGSHRQTLQDAERIER